MNAEITLYDKALSNYNSARILRDNLGGDDNQVNIIGYLLQQSVELLIKYLLEQSGVEYPKSHDIEQLIRLAEENSVDLNLTEYISEHSEMFSQWEAKSRYVLGYLIELKKIDRAIEEVERYIAAVHSALAQ